MDNEKGRYIVTIQQSKTDAAAIGTDAYIPFDDGITDIKKILSTYLNALDTYVASNKMIKNPSILWRAIRNNHFFDQRVGVNTLGSIPQLVAQYLRLPDPKQYTGHCMRRSAATVAAANGASLETLKKIGRWNSSNVPSLYVDKSGIDTWNAVQQTMTSRTSVSMDASTSSSSMRTMFHDCRIGNINIYIKEAKTEDSVKEDNNTTPNSDIDIFQEIPPF